MGTSRYIPNVGSLVFSNYTGTSPNTQQMSAINTLRSSGIKYTTGYFDYGNPSNSGDSYRGCNVANAIKIGFYYIDNTRERIGIGYKISATATMYTTIIFQSPAGRYDLTAAVMQPGISFPAYYDIKPEAVINSGWDIFDNKAAIEADFGVTRPITYRLTNCSAPSAPTAAAGGSVVNVNLVFQQGYGIVNPQSDVYVTNNGVRISSSYSNGRLTFTMPAS